MIKKTFISSLAAAAAIALALTGCSSSDSGNDGASPAPAGETFKLKLTSYNLENSMEGTATKQWAEELAEESDGQLKIDIFFQETLLSGAETLAGVADGRAQLGYIAGAYYPGELPLSAVAGIPFITSDMKAQGQAFQELYETNEDFKNEWESQGVKVLHWAPVAENILALTKPIDSIEDLENLKIRGYGYVSQTLDAAGAAAISMGQGEVYESLQRGVLDGTSGAPLDVMADRDFYEVAPNIVDINYGNYAIAGTVMNLDTWNSLPENLQELITQKSGEYLEKYLEIVDVAQDAACTEILDSGASVSVLNADEMSDWAEATRTKIEDTWKADVAKSNANVDVDAFLADYLAALDKYTPEEATLTVTAQCAER